MLVCVDASMKMFWENPNIFAALAAVFYQTRKTKQENPIYFDDLRHGNKYFREFPDIFRLCVGAVVIIGLKYIRHNTKMLWFVCKYMICLVASLKIKLVDKWSTWIDKTIPAREMCMHMFLSDTACAHDAIKRQGNSPKEILEDCKILLTKVKPD